MYAIKMLNITKKFNGFKANDNITLKVRKNEIHAILGENGAGKSTLMNILFGIYKKDAGKIFLDDQETTISNPKIASKMGIGMVHQHFTLIDDFTVTQNIILGNEPKNGICLDIKQAKKKVEQIAKTYKLNIYPDDYIKDLNAAMQQRVEILKMLYRSTNVLILDEPTSVLSPEEIDELMVIIKQLKDEGKTIILITHKLREIKLLADSCTVLRKGKSVERFNIKDNVTHQELATAMIGSNVDFDLNERFISDSPGKNVVMNIKNISYRKDNNLVLDNISFALHNKEILGISGVEGNGQNELVDIILGQLFPTYGKIEFLGTNILNLDTRRRNELGISYIPEDRHKQGLILDFTVSNNIILKYLSDPLLCGRGILNKKRIDEFSQHIYSTYNIQSNDSINTLTRNLSGGNQQKIIVGRELNKSHKLLIAFQPTRGLDILGINFMHKKICEERKKGTAILLISYELDEILKLSDRILVLSEGKVMDIVKGDTTREELGLLIAGINNKKGYKH